MVVANTARRVEQSQGKAVFGGAEINKLALDTQDKVAHVLAKQVCL